MNVPIQIRLGEKTDLHLILDSWNRCIKNIYPNNYAIDFTKHYDNYLHKLLDNSIIVVANLEDEPKEIISYLVYSSFRSDFQVIHFAYTKIDARQQGIVKRLIHFSNPNGMPIIFTHPAKNENIMKALSKKYIYDPSILQ